MGLAVPLLKLLLSMSALSRFTCFFLLLLSAALPHTLTAQETPLAFEPGSRIALIGNALLDQERVEGVLETLLQQKQAGQNLVFRNLCWPADEITIRPRPENFGDIHVHLNRVKADIIIASYGFNESFAGLDKIPEFEGLLAAFLTELKSHQYNGKSAPIIILVSPVPNEDAAPLVKAGTWNNERIAAYAAAMKKVAAAQNVRFVDAYTPLKSAMEKERITTNGVTLTPAAYQKFAGTIYQNLTGQEPSVPNDKLREVVIDKNQRFFLTYRPLNLFYITGGRKSPYGVVNFPKEFERLAVLIENRDKRIQEIASGKAVPAEIDDSNAPEIPVITGDRPINEWLSPQEELASFKIDPRFEVNCFVSEEDFPEFVKPIQMRFDTQGRLWVSTSQTYPQLLPDAKPVDKILILEDTDKDGRADKCSVFAEGLQIPLSFEFGDGGVYVSEQPHLTFLKDTDGDGKADHREIKWTGFGTEDSHHSLHDFTWTPQGDLIFRESIFHHSQIETPRGPVRVRDSGWFLYRPAEERLTTFGTYYSTNPWGLTFDDWGWHQGSHPVFAAAFHSLNPPYPQQHQSPTAFNIPAYSGTCGQEFIYHPHFPDELQGGFLRVRYKPTNNVEIHEWQKNDTHFVEKKTGDLIFSTNLSFIPVDIKMGPRGDFYVCDWYNPVKGHMQYSLRDTRRDKTSGRIWRIVAKNRPLTEPPAIHDQPIPALLKVLEHPVPQFRYWARRELDGRDKSAISQAIPEWQASFAATDARREHHLVEAMWLKAGLLQPDAALLESLANAKEPQARAAAIRQLRWWHEAVPQAIPLLQKAANDPVGLVRLEAAIAASWIGTEDALFAALQLLDHPRDGYIDYALRCSVDSEALQQFWKGRESDSRFGRLVAFRTQTEKGKKSAKKPDDKNPFDKKPDLLTVTVSTVPERLLFTVREITAKPGQPVKLVFENPDATPHNLVIVTPGALEEIGMAANEMAKDPQALDKGFLPDSPKVLQATKMLSQDQSETLRFLAPEKSGVYPYLCTFPGHWLVMKGELIVK
jgi:plastocyanin